MSCLSGPCLPNFKVTLISLYFCSGVAQEVIPSPPQSVSVTEGEDTTFTCMALNNGSPVTVGWRFIPNGGKSSSEVPLITGTTLTGVEMVTVSDGLRTMLTFSGVRREADGGMVVCRTAVARSDPATVTVQCE